MRTYSFLPHILKLRFMLMVLLVSLFATSLIMLFFLPMQEITSCLINSEQEVRTIKAFNWKILPQ